MRTAKSFTALVLAALLAASAAACGTVRPAAETAVPAAEPLVTAPLPTRTPPPPVETEAPEPPAPTPAEIPGPTPEPPVETVTDYTLDYGTAQGVGIGAYDYVSVTGLTPYIFCPTGAGSDRREDFLGVSDMLRAYGEENGMLAAFNAGVFYDTTEQGLYCFRAGEADGVVIAGGVVLKSVESLDHSECDILVIDEDGNAGWADYWADADALAAGKGAYYDIYGESVTGKRIISAVTGFVPILIGGEAVYDAGDRVRFGYDNYVDHYTQAAPRQIFGARADGGFVMLTNRTDWTLRDAAEAARAQGCVFAYNLDGGSSVETAVADTSGGDYAVRTLRQLRYGWNRVPTYFVFSTRSRAPVSAVPTSIRAELAEDAAFPAGVTPEELAAALAVTETLTNADGRTSERRVYSAQALADTTLPHTVIGGSGDPSLCEIKTQTVTPNGTLYYAKSEADARHSLYWNKNTRLDGSYYDYSTGFTVSTADDLTTPGEKTLLVSYVPGGGYAPLTAEILITIR